MKARIVVALLLGVAALGGANKADKVAGRCNNAARLLDDIMATPEKAIPRDLLRRAHCVALIPGVKKVGFVFAGRFGKGVLLCRGEGGSNWNGPSAVRIEGGSFGLQIGGSSTDIVLLVMNEEGAEKLRASKFTLGADAAVAGGPVGRSLQAQTDAKMHAKILSYSRSRGVFAGVSLEGATLRPDAGANQLLYGEPVSHQDILTGKSSPPAAANDLLSVLGRHSSRDGKLEVVAKDQTTGSTVENSKPPRQTRGLIKITSNPDLAEVELNGSFNGLTPRGKAVKPGKYEITLKKKGFTVWTESITVAAGETIEVHAELEAAQVSTASLSREGDSEPSGNSRVQISGIR